MAKWLERSLPWAASICAALVAAGIVLHLYLRRDLPPLDWSESELPALPPGNLNGWMLISREQGKLSSRTMSSEVRELAVNPSWRGAVRRRTLLKEYTSDPDSIFQFEILEQALAMPSFRDACPLDPTWECPYLAWIHLHETERIRILQKAVDSDWEASLSEMSHLIRADADLLQSSRRPLSGSIAASNGYLTMHLLSVLLDGLPQQGTSAVSFQLRDILRGLDSMTDGAAATQRAVLSEYLFVRQLIEMMDQRTPRFSSRHLFLLRGILFDPLRALRAEGPYFEQLMKSAKAGPTAPVPSRQPMSSQKFWWIDNPAGKRAVDMMLQRLSSETQRLKEDHALLARYAVAVKAKLKARLRSLPQ